MTSGQKTKDEQYALDNLAVKKQIITQNYHSGMITKSQYIDQMLNAEISYDRAIAIIRGRKSKKHPRKTNTLTQQAARRKNWGAYLLYGLANKVINLIKNPFHRALILHLISDELEERGFKPLKIHRKYRAEGTDDAKFHGHTILADRYRLEFRPRQKVMGRTDWVD